MPVYLVLINSYGRRHPQRVGVATAQPSVEAAIAWALEVFPGRVRDIDVEVLSERDDCWYAADGTVAA